MSFRHFTDMLWRRREPLAAVLLLLAAFMVFLPSLRFPFLETWDDAELTANVRYLQLTVPNLAHWWQTPLVGVYMPLTMFSYMLDHTFWGANPLGYRLQSLFWHLFTAYMVFRCFRVGGIRLWLAWTAAAIFAIQPQRLESVAWISERKDVLCGAFYFWALYRYLIDSGKERFNRSAWILTALALLAKPMAVSLPVIFILIDLHRRRRLEVRYYLRKFAPYLALIAVIAVVAFQAQTTERPLTLDWFNRLPVILHNYYWYTLNCLWPYDLNPFHSQVIFSQKMIAVTAVFYLTAILLTGAVWYRQGRDVCLYDWSTMAVAYLVALAPVVGFIHLGNIDYADRYSYIPSVFLLFIFTRSLQMIASDRTWRQLSIAAGLSIYLVWLGSMTLAYLPSWRSYYDLLTWSAKSSRPNQFALVEFGLAERWRGHYDRVAALAGRLDAATTGEDRLLPGSGHFYAELLRAESDYGQKRYVEAERRLVAIYPIMAPARFYSPGLEITIHQRLIGGRMNRGHYRQALDYIDRLLQWYDQRPHDFFYYYYRGLRAGMLHDWAQAHQDFQTAWQLNGATKTSAAELREVLRRCEGIELKHDPK